MLASVLKRLTLLFEKKGWRVNSRSRDFPRKTAGTLSQTRPTKVMTTFRGMLWRLRGRNYRADRQRPVHAAIHARFPSRRRERPCSGQRTRCAAGRWRIRRCRACRPDLALASSTKNLLAGLDLSSRVLVISTEGATARSVSAQCIGEADESVLERQTIGLQAPSSARTTVPRLERVDPAQDLKPTSGVASSAHRLSFSV